MKCQSACFKNTNTITTTSNNNNTKKYNHFVELFLRVIKVNAQTAEIIDIFF